MRYQQIESRIWYDEKFKNLTESQQRLFLYILTCPHGNLMGLFVLPIGYIFEDLKTLPKYLTKSLVKDQFKEHESIRQDLIDVVENGLVDYDEKTCVIWVKKLLKHNPITNPNQIKSAISKFKELPKSSILQKFVTECKYLPKGLSEVLTEVLLEVNSKPEPLPEPLPEPEKKERPSGLSSSTGEPVSDGDDSKPGKWNGKGKAPNCPIQEIVSRWHEILPVFAEVKFLDKTTRANVRNRWAEDPDRWTLEWWEDFFRYIGESDFLSGRKTDWKASFPWVMGPKNFAKIINGQYNNNRALPRKTQSNIAAADTVKRLIQEGKV
jgi:hypothetical protein